MVVSWAVYILQIGAPRGVFLEFGSCQLFQAQCLGLIFQILISCFTVLYILILEVENSMGSC